MHPLQIVFLPQTRNLDVHVDVFRDLSRGTTSGVGLSAVLCVHCGIRQTQDFADLVV